jgi:hypothetical protein
MRSLSRRHAARYSWAMRRRLAFLLSAMLILQLLPGFSVACASAQQSPPAVMRGDSMVHCAEHAAVTPLRQSGHGHASHECCRHGAACQCASVLAVAPAHSSRNTATTVLAAGIVAAQQAVFRPDELLRPPIA